MGFEPGLIVWPPLRLAQIVQISRFPGRMDVVDGGDVVTMLSRLGAATPASFVPPVERVTHSAQIRTII